MVPVNTIVYKADYSGGQNVKSVMVTEKNIKEINRLFDRVYFSDIIDAYDVSIYCSSVA